MRRSDCAGVVIDELCLCHTTPICATKLLSDFIRNKIPKGLLHCRLRSVWAADFMQSKWELATSVRNDTMLCLVT